MYIRLQGILVPNTEQIKVLKTVCSPRGTDKEPTYLLTYLLP